MNYTTTTTNQPTYQESTSGKLNPYKVLQGSTLHQVQFTGENALNCPKMTINLDWCEMSFLGELGKPDQDGLIRFDDGSIILEKLDYAFTKRYNEGYRIYVDGEDFGRIEASPKNPNINPNLVKIQVNNHILYQRGWVDRLQYLSGWIGLEFNNVTRIDVAIDGGDFLGGFDGLIRERYGKVGKAKVAAVRTGKMELEGFYIGSAKSEKRIRGYNKSREIKESGANKTYIPAFWKANGLDTTKDIERLEIVMKGKALRKVKGFDFRKLEDTRYLAGLAKCMVKGFYEFVDMGSDSNVSRGKRIQPVAWEYFDGVEVIREKKTNEPSVVWAVKQAVAFEMREAFSTRIKQNDRPYREAYDKCHERCKTYGILGWFDRKVKDWEKDAEYHRKIRVRRHEVLGSPLALFGQKAKPVKHPIPLARPLPSKPTKDNGQPEPYNVDLTVW